MDWWNVSVFVVIPILAVVAMFMFKRKLLWIAPFISLLLAITVTGIEIGFSEFVENHYQLLWLTMFLNFAITIVLTGVIFAVSKLRSQRK